MTPPPWGAIRSDWTGDCGPESFSGLVPPRLVRRFSRNNVPQQSVMILGRPRKTNMTIETVNQVMDSTLDTVDYVESMAFEVGKRAGFLGDSLNEISLAVHETTANAVIHGNQHNPQKKILV